MLYAYCYSLFGSVLWNLVHSCIDSVYSAWRSGQRRVWGLPFNSHSSLLPIISGAIPIQDELAKRFVSFAHSCLSSESKLVRSVASHAIRFNPMNSPFGRYVSYCCARYQVIVGGIHRNQSVILLVTPKY